MFFEWDNAKAEANLKKHGVSFAEAESVFEDLFGIDFYDPKHAESEHRFVIVGESNRQRLLIVSYVERNDKIRLISARELTSKERRDYEHGEFE